MESSRWNTRIRRFAWLPVRRGWARILSAIHHRTGHEQAEQALRESEARLRQANELLEAVTMGAKVIIAAVDTEFRYTFFNEAYREEIDRLGGRGLRLGVSMAEILADMPVQREIALNAWRPALRGESSNYRITFGDPGRYSKTYSVFHTPIRNDEGQVVGAGEVALDITDQVRAEVAIRETEQLKQAVLDAVTANVAVLDQAGNIIAINQPWRRFALDNNGGIGRPTPNTGIGVNYLDVCRAARGESAEGALEVHDGTKAVLEGRVEMFSHEYPCHSPQAKRWFSLTVTPLGVERGGAVVSHLDITASRKLMDELRGEKDRFTKIVATVPGGIFSFRRRLDGSTCCPYVSPAFVDIYGLPPEELAVSAAPLWAMIHPDDLDHVGASVVASARTMTPWRDEFRLRHPNKGEIWIEGHSMPVCEPDGSILWHGYVQDITARKRAEETLQESAAIYHAIGESIDYGVWICAPDGRNTYASDSFLKLVGLTQEQCSNFGWGDVLHPDDAERTITAWKEFARTGGVWDIEHRFRGTDGQYHAILARGVPVKNARGETVCWAGINLDISRLKQTEEALRRSLEEKETLLREVHHRVKNNLAAIIDLLELQREGMTDAPITCRLAELGNRIRSMALVHEMLYQSASLDRIDFQEYLQTLVAYLRNAFDPHGAIWIDVAATGVYMDIDTAIPCGLIVNELVINALKYAFPPSRRQEASACQISIAAAWDGAAYTLTVTDNGVGLPAGLDWATTRTLGLRLVRMLGQHQLGGQLELDGGRGSRFSLRFAPKQNTENRSP